MNNLPRTPLVVRDRKPGLFKIVGLGTKHDLVVRRERVLGFFNNLPAGQMH
jgi:hypothetical protein